MAISNRFAADSETETPLLLDTVHGAVDFKGRHVLRSRSGRWRAAAFIIVVEVAERFAYYGINSNLINYLTGPLGQSIATAAENVNIWSGTASLLPLFGAFVADSFLGRYHTIIVSSLIYILALVLLTLSATLPVSGISCQDVHNSTSCSKFQDNVGWVLGFGIPCVVMVISLFVFLLGTWTYRFSIQGDEKSPFLRIGRVFVVAVKNWRTTHLAIKSQEEASGTLPHQGSEQFKFLNKALVAPDGSKEDGKVCGVNEVEEAKQVLRLFPIWVASLMYAIVFAQSSTFFTKQGVTMDRQIFSGFYVPAASLQSFISLSIFLFIPIYDRIIVPLARAFTRKPSGISMLQRIGTGMFLSAISMAIAAFVEMQRLKTAQEYGLIDKPNVTIPMSVWWLIPQYVLFGVSDVFTMVGLQEFFYDQVPNELRSVGLALYLSIFGVGSFLSSFLVSAIQKATGGNGKDSWFASNINRAHLDYFYVLLAILSAVGLSAFLFFSKSYVYNRAST